MVQAPAGRQLAMLGFTTAGVAASSLAAAWQSSIGNVAAGSAGAGTVRSIYPAK